MTLPQVYELFDYWRSFPPEHEMLSMLARVYTTWTPVEKPTSEEERRAEHQRSLEARWAAGALNVKQLFEAGGALTSQGTIAGRPRGDIGGIGPHPGA